MNRRRIPSTGEQLPVIGCGTYVGFDRQPGSSEYARLPQVLQALRSAGYAGQEIVKFFNGLGGEFRKFFDNLGKWLNPKNWFRRAHDPNAPRTAADAFLDRLEEDSFREELLPAMADVEPGDWDAIVRIARTAGYEFTAEEFMQAVPDGFFQGAGEYPELGWDRSTLLPQAH